MIRHTLLAVSLLATPAFAQTVITHTAAEITQLEDKMLAQAKAAPTGVSFTTIDVTPTSSMLVIARVHTGEAELHGHVSGDPGHGSEVAASAGQVRRGQSQRASRDERPWAAGHGSYPDRA